MQEQWGCISAFKLSVEGVRHSSHGRQPILVPHFQYTLHFLLHLKVATHVVSQKELIF